MASGKDGSRGERSAGAAFRRERPCELRDAFDVDTDGVLGGEGERAGDDECVPDAPGGLDRLPLLRRVRGAREDLGRKQRPREREEWIDVPERAADRRDADEPSADDVGDLAGDDIAVECCASDEIEQTRPLIGAFQHPDDSRRVDQHRLHGR